MRFMVTLHVSCSPKIRFSFGHPEQTKTWVIAYVCGQIFSYVTPDRSDFWRTEVDEASSLYLLWYCCHRINDLLFNCFI